MKFYTYQYFDPSRNEMIYIGKGQKNRATDHLTRTDRHPLTHRLKLMVKNGVTPVISKIFLESEELALLCEQEMISLFGRKDLNEGTLLNLTNGGDGISGYKHTAEAKQKVSFARLNRSEETSRKQSEAQKLLVRKTGWKHSEESKQRMSENRKLAGNANRIGFKHSEESKMLMSEKMRTSIMNKKISKGAA